jgi:hypothetical protein
MSGKQTAPEYPRAIACENNAVPSSKQGKYLAQGTWAVDFGSGHSFRKQDATADDKRAVSESFNRVAEASREVRPGTLRSSNSELVATGWYGPNGIQLLEENSKAGSPLKGLQFHEYAVLGPGDEFYEEVMDLADTMGGTVNSLTDEKTARLVDILSELRRQGFLRGLVHGYE